MDIDLRHLDTSEHDAALAIVKECYPDLPSVWEEFTGRFNASFSTPKWLYAVKFVGAFDHNTLIGIAGYAQSSATDMCWELSWACVRPDLQGRGIGQNLLDYRFSQVIEAANTDEVHAVIHSLPSRLFLSNGFDEIRKVGTKSLLAKQLR